MHRRLDDEGADIDRYGPYYGQRSRVGLAEPARLNSRDCARNYIERDARAYADSRIVVNVRRRSRRSRDEAAMIGRLCAAQLARQIVRALHVAPPEQSAQAAGPGPAKRKVVKARKKRKAA